MKLSLKNIRQHKSKEIVFPDKGIVRLKGPSGIGKTTLFDAIRHAAYGDIQGMTHWDETSSKIEMEWLGCKFTRTMRPNAFRLEKDSKAFVDDEAEAEVQKLLDMSAEEFGVSSYVQQEFDQSLLQLSPADQLRLIQRLAFGADDPEVTKAKIKTVIDQKIVEVKLAEQSVAQAESDYQKTRSRLELLLPVRSEPAKPIDDAGLQADYQALERKQKAAKSRVEDAKAKINHPIHALISTRQVRVATRDEVFATNLPLIEAAKKRLAALPESVDVGSLKVQKAGLEAQKEYFLVQKRNTAAIKTLDAAFPRPQGTKLYDFILSEIDRVLAETARYEEGVARAKEELSSIARSKDSLTCPACNASLRYLSGTLELHNHSAPDPAREEFLKQVIDHGQNTLNELSKAGSELVVAKRSLESMRDQMAKLAKPEVKTEAELQTKLAEVESKLAEAATLKVKRENEQANVSVAEKAVERAQKALDDLEKQIEAFGNIPPKEIVEKELAEAQAQVEGLADTMKVVMTGILENQKARADWNEWEGERKRILAATLEVEQSLKAVGLAKKTLSKVTEEHAAALRLKEISDVAALEAIGAVFNSINFNAKTYIDQMFPDTGTQVILKNKKELKSGDERAKPSLYVYHKGSVARNFKDLSGGEKGRIKLAFHLALADMYKSLLLLADEPFAGMDEASRALAFECLENISKNKLVVIIDHNIDGSAFDAEIDLSTD